MTKKQKLNINISIAILINLIPVWGVIFQNWSAYNILFVFWLQTLVIGVINVPKIIFYYKKFPTHVLWALLFFLLPFIIMMPFLYFFMYFFLNSSIISIFVSPGQSLIVDDYKIFSDFMIIFKNNLSILWILFINEIYKFFVVFIGEKEYQEGRDLPVSVPSGDRINDPTFEPLGRALSIGILALIGFIPTLVTNSTLPAVILLVIGKIAFDIQVEKYHFEKQEKGTREL
jgi:hypothetical protein